MILTSSRRVTAEIRTPVNYDLVTRCSTDGAEDNSLTSQAICQSHLRQTSFTLAGIKDVENVFRFLSVFCFQFLIFQENKINLGG